ncbi:MAG TPA: molybdopterin-dependent oxidoreductase, partial [Anaerolineales bacterium]|nr:molybdopterin-dependent oxidoreductase [Anaerolineales bacterium]
ERNHFCPFCQVSGGDCELQNAAYSEEMTHWPIQPGWNDFVVDSSHPYFVLDNNRCILCRRCVRACAEMAGNFTLSVAERGAKSTIVADTDVLLGESTCIKCGSCVQVCPTGAIIDRTSAYQVHDKELTPVRSICRGCSVGCAVTLMVRDNRIVRIEGDWEGQINRGVLCEFGRYAPVTDARKRLTSPLMKKNGKLEPVSWNEALKVVADHLKPLTGETDGIAAIVSTRLSAETLTAFKDLFAGNEVVTSIEEGLPTASTFQYAQKQGVFEGRLDLLKTADTVLCIGTDLGRNHMVAGFLFKRNLPKGTRLINIDPEKNELDELSNLSLKNNPGSDLALIHGIQAIIVKEGLGRSPLAIATPERLIDEAIQETGLTLEQLTQAARILANSITPVIVYGNGITAQRDECLVEELYNLAVLIGAIDQERAGLLSIKGQSNSVTAALLGLDKTFHLNGQKAVYVALGDDRVTPSLVERLSRAPYLVVQASYESKLTEQADIVLPVTIWSELEGHYINLDGRVQKAAKVLDAPADVHDNLTVLHELATRMNMSLESNWQQAILGRKSSVALMN